MMLIFVRRRLGLGGRVRQLGYNADSPHVSAQVHVSFLYTGGFSESVPIRPISSRARAGLRRKIGILVLDQLQRIGHSS